MKKKIDKLANRGHAYSNQIDMFLIKVLNCPCIIIVCPYATALFYYMHQLIFLAQHVNKTMINIVTCVQFLETRGMIFESIIG